MSAEKVGGLPSSLPNDDLRAQSGLVSLVFADKATCCRGGEFSSCNLLRNDSAEAIISEVSDRTAKVPSASEAASLVLVPLLVLEFTGDKEASDGSGEEVPTVLKLAQDSDDLIVLDRAAVFALHLARLAATRFSSFVLNATESSLTVTSGIE